MRASVGLAGLVFALGCAGRADNDDPNTPAASSGGSGGRGAASTSGGWSGEGISLAGRPPATFDQCDCLPECAPTAAELEESLCRLANERLIVKTTYEGCDDVEYSDMYWELDDTYHLKGNLLTGCTGSTAYGSSSTADVALSASCDSAILMRCAVCPERADRYVRMHYNVPACE